MSDRSNDVIFTQAKKKKAPDSWVLGILAGIVFPLLGLVFLMFFWGDGNAKVYFSYFTDVGNARSMEASSKLISLSMIANLLPFYYFLNRKSFRSTKGIILMMFLWAIVIFSYKFLLQ